MFNWLHPLYEMEGAIGAESSGVEGAQVASAQTEVTADTSVEGAESQTGVEQDGAADPEKQNNFEKAFAKRLSQAKEKWEKEIGDKYKDYDTHSKYSKELERAAKLNGWDSVEEFVARMNEVEQQQRVAQEAQKLGVDEETYRQFLQPVNEKLTQYEQQLQELQKEKAMTQLEANLKDLRGKYDDFAKYEESVIDMALKKGYGLDEAYRIASYDDKLSSIKTQAEQEALKKLQTNAASSPGALGAEGAEHKTGIMSMSRAEIAALAEKVKRGEVRSL